MNPVMEESVESILDASDITFEDSRDDILGDSRIRPGYGQQQQQQQRRSAVSFFKSVISKIKKARYLY